MLVVVMAVLKQNDGLSTVVVLVLWLRCCQWSWCLEYVSIKVQHDGRTVILVVLMMMVNQMIIVFLCNDCWVMMKVAVLLVIMETILAMVFEMASVPGVLMWSAVKVVALVVQKNGRAV